ncbi:MAG: hypothetical protein ABIL01_04900 [Pseudomonadota bacterium]
MENSSGNPFLWRGIGNFGRGVTAARISLARRIAAIAFVEVLSRWRDSLAISAGAV